MSDTNFHPRRGRRRGIDLQRWRLWAVPLLLAASISGAWADRVEYKDGRVVEGEIVYQDEEYVRIRDGSGVITIFAKSIRRVVEGSKADVYLISAKSEFSKGNVHRALSELAEAVRMDISPESLVTVLQHYEVRLREVAPHLDGARRSELSAVLEHSAGAQLERDGEPLLTRVRLYMALGDFKTADVLLERLAKKHDRLFELEKDSLSRGFNDEIERALEDRDFARALDLIIRFRRLDEGAASDKQVLLDLRWARDEREKENFDRALEIYIDQLMEGNPQIAKNRILDALAEAERTYRRRDELGRAIELYEIYGMPYAPDSVRGRLTRLWVDAGDEQMERDAFEDARKMFDRAERLTPGSGMRSINLADYGMQRAALDPADALGHYRLGEWCIEKELYYEAKEAFERAGEAESLRTTAWAQLSFVDNAIAEEELKRLIGLFEKGNYSETLEGLSRFQSQPLTPGLRIQSGELDRLTRNGILLRAKARPQQAEVLWQQAERAFYAGEVADSAMTLRTLIERFDGTPAGARAEQFYKKIQMHMDLDEIERGRWLSNKKDNDVQRGTRTTTPLALEIESLRGSIRRVDTNRKSSDGESPQNESPGAWDKSDLGLTLRTAP